MASEYGRAAVTRICARRNREAATNSMAFVIFAVFLIDRILRRMSRKDGIGRSQNSELRTQIVRRHHRNTVFFNVLRCATENG
jgi:hypothetical protein